MFNKIVVIISLFSLLSFPAFAVLGMGNTSLEVMEGPGGGGTKEGTGYFLQDLIAVPVTGVSSAGSYVLEIGGIYALGEISGSISLEIERDGDHIKISWDPSVAVWPQFYVLTGDGTGQYVNSYDASSWILTDPTTDPDYAAYSGYIHHLNQVGMGDAATYYKALLPGTNLNTPDGLTAFASASAVGKLNVDLYTGWNFVASPFMFNQAGFDASLGTDFTNGDQIWVWDDDGQNFIAPTVFDGTTWGTASFESGEGNLLYLPGSSITVSLIGGVKVGPFTDTLYDGWNLIGNAAPVLSDMSEFSSNNGDQLWEWDNSQQKFIAPLTYDGANWPTGTEFKPGKAYGYMR